MDFKPFDNRHFATVPVRDGYGEWAATYEDSVVDLMDLRLLAGLTTVDWTACRTAADLACGTGRTGVWLRGAGVVEVHGIDCTPAMLDRARAKGAHSRLVVGDLAATGFDAGAYDLVAACLVDEHLADLRPMYAEAGRLLVPGGRFVLVGYHPHFLMLGIATHFDRQPGQSIAIESHVHLTSDHVAAAHAAGFRLTEMREGVIDDAWATAKPKWYAKYRHHPVTFALAWQADD